MRGRLSAQDAERRRTRFRLLGFSLLLLFAAALVWGRCVLSEARQTETLAEAASALDSALKGHEASWADAEEAYARASRSAILDPYPLWVVELIAAWRASRPASSTQALQDVLVLIRARDYRGAAQKGAQLEASKMKEYVLRLVSELSAMKEGPQSP